MHRVSHLFKIKPDYFLTLFLSEGGKSDGIIIQKTFHIHATFSLMCKCVLGSDSLNLAWKTTYFRRIFNFVGM